MYQITADTNPAPKKLISERKKTATRTGIQQQKCFDIVIGYWYATPARTGRGGEGEEGKDEWIPQGPLTGT